MRKARQNGGLFQTTSYVPEGGFPQSPVASSIMVAQHDNGFKRAADITHHQSSRRLHKNSQLKMPFAILESTLTRRRQPRSLRCAGRLSCMTGMLRFQLHFSRPFTFVKSSSETRLRVPLPPYTAPCSHGTLTSPHGFSRSDSTGLSN